MRPRPFLEGGAFGRHAIWLFLLLVLGTQGCGDAASRADGYRVQQGLWSAYRAEQSLQLLGSVPDSTALLGVMKHYVAAAERASAALRALPPVQSRTPAEKRLLQIVSQAEIEAARLAHAAGRPELALERCRALVQLAEGDTSVTSRADILIAGSLRRMGRHEEAIDAMKGMMVRYPPRAPDSTGVEDFILNIPQMIVDLRKELGDEEGARREVDAAKRYYQGLILGGKLEPALEAQVRSRLVHSLLELKDTSGAMAGIDSLESLVTRVPGLTGMIPDVRYTKIKVRSMSERDHTESIQELGRLSLDFPASPVAPRSLFDAAVLMEQSNRIEDARQAYENVVARYPSISELASTSLLRQALLEDRSGRWEKSKGLLESVPTKYPRTGAAAQAPLSIVEHYGRVGDNAGVQAALRKAADTYERMVLTDSISPGAARLRWNLLRCYIQLRDNKKAFRTVDGLLEHHAGSPFLPAALLQGAKIAEDNKLKQVALGYLGRYIQDYPTSPQADGVRARIRVLTR